MVPTGMLGRRLYVPLFLLSFLFCSSFVLAKERKEAESVLWGSFPSSGEERKLEEGLNQEKEEGDGTTTRQTTQTLYPYVLQNECTVNIQHNITQAPEEQTVFFDALSLLVSDLRMILPETCRRSSLWILCNLAFPCQSQVCSVTREDCEFAFKDCPPSDLTLNCSSFPTESEALEMEEEKKRWWGGEERGWIDGIGNNVLEEEYFVTVQESAETPNPVTTCLADRGEEIQCCLDPFTKKSDTDECVLACPSYPFGETRYKALTYTHFALLWITTVLVIAALVPLLFLKQTLTFPKYAMPAAMVATLFWLHNEMWSIYVGLLFFFFFFFFFFCCFFFFFFLLLLLSWLLLLLLGRLLLMMMFGFLFFWFFFGCCCNCFFSVFCFLFFFVVFYLCSFFPFLSPSSPSKFLSFFNFQPPQPTTTNHNQLQVLTNICVEMKKILLLLMRSFSLVPLVLRNFMSFIFLEFWLFLWFLVFLLCFCTFLPMG